MKIAAFAINLLFAFLSTSCWIDTAYEEQSNSLVSHRANQTRCCWCVLQIDSENAVIPYLSESKCANRPTLGGYKSCRSVMIQEAECSLIKVQSVGPDGSMRCITQRLSYLEDGVVQFIDPPIRPHGECTLFGSIGSGDSLDDYRKTPENSNEKNDPNAHFCQCIQDPDFYDSCSVMRFEKNGTTTRIEKRRKPIETDQCNQVCSKLFPDWPSFFPICRQRN